MRCLVSLQTATQQTKKTDYKKYPESKTAGGGFGPVRYEHAVEPRYFQLSGETKSSSRLREFKKADTVEGLHIRT